MHFFLSRKAAATFPVDSVGPVRPLEGTPAPAVPVPEAPSSGQAGLPAWRSRLAQAILDLHTYWLEEDVLGRGRVGWQVLPH
jgi:hypothetical protein